MPHRTSPFFPRFHPGPGRRAAIGLLAGLALAPPPPPARAAGTITTLAALYGTPARKRTCDATRVVARACDGRKSCAVLASNALCGDPDYGTPKSLDVEYQCGPAVAKSTTATEQTEASLRCD